MEAIVGWLAPIVSTLIVCAGQLALNARFKLADEKRDAARAETEAKRKAEAEWRDEMARRMREQEEAMETVLNLQCSQTRSDILHKCHRYIDDLKGASNEEKEALWAEHMDYKRVCEANGIENNFIAELVHQVMALPDRPNKKE